MDAPEDNRAGGAGALPARDCGTSSDLKSTPLANRAQSPDGARSAAGFIGTVMRHARQAQSINLRHGPGRRVGRELDRAREALDSARWLCDYCGGDQ